MASFQSLRDLVNNLPSTNEAWGPPTTTETTLDGVPYAPFSKGDKLGRMADWTSEGKDSARGGRQQYQQRYRDQIYGAGGLQTVFNIEGQNEEGIDSRQRLWRQRKRCFPWPWWPTWRRGRPWRQGCFPAL
jgi:translation initiation factor 3 subunit D